MAYLTLGEAKAWLQITTADYDAVVTDLVNEASAAIDAYCETKFGEETVTGELIDGARQDVIVPEGFPITSVQEVKVGIGLDGTGGAVLPASDYVVREEGIYLRYATTGHGRGRVSVSYKYGYTATPAPVKRAAKLAVESWFRLWQRKLLGGGVTAKSKEGESISFKGAWDGASGLPVEATSLLQPYRAVGFPGPRAMATRGQ